MNQEVIEAAEAIVRERGQIYSDLEVHPGFIDLMGIIERECEERLQTLRDTQASDPVVIHDLWCKWREADLLLTIIRSTILTAKLEYQELTGVIA